MGDRNPDRNPTVRELEVIGREEEALSLRTSGLTLQAISERMHLGGRNGAKRIIDRALMARRAESVDEHRELLRERLETAHRAIWPQVLAGDVPATMAAVRIMDRYAKLYGADAPVKIDAGDGQITVRYSLGMQPTPLDALPPVIVDANES